MEHKLVAVTHAEISADGRDAALHIATETAPVFRLQFETARLDEVIAQLLAIALSAGAAQGVGPAPSAGSPVSTVPIPTSGAGVTLGPPGYALLVVRVGCIDLALQIENARTRSIGQELAALGARLESEPKTAQ